MKKCISVICLLSLLFQNVLTASDRLHTLQEKQKTVLWQVERLPAQNFSVMQNGVQISEGRLQDGVVQFEQLPAGNYGMFAKTETANVQFAFTVGVQKLGNVSLATTVGCQQVRLQQGVVRGRIVTRTLWTKEQKLVRIKDDAIPVSCQCDVRILHPSKPARRCKTDKHGYFEFGGCKPGEYVIQAGGQMGYLEYPVELCEAENCLPFEGCLMDPVDASVCRKSIECGQPVAACGCAGGIMGGGFGSGGGGGGGGLGGGGAIGGFLGGALAALLGAGLANGNERQMIHSFPFGGGDQPASPSN